MELNKETKLTTTISVVIAIIFAIIYYTTGFTNLVNKILRIEEKIAYIEHIRERSEIDNRLKGIEVDVKWIMQHVSTIETNMH